MASRDRDHEAGGRQRVGPNRIAVAHDERKAVIGQNGNKRGRHIHEAPGDAVYRERDNRREQQHQQPARDDLIDLVGRNGGQPSEQVNERCLKYFLQLAPLIAVHHGEVEKFVPIGLEAQHQIQSRCGEQNQQPYQDGALYREGRVTENQSPLQQERDRRHGNSRDKPGKIIVQPCPIERANDRDIGQVQDRPGCREKKEPSLKPGDENEPALRHEADDDFENERNQAGQLIRKADNEAQRVYGIGE